MKSNYQTPMDIRKKNIRRCEFTSWCGYVSLLLFVVPRSLWRVVVGGFIAEMKCQIEYGAVFGFHPYYTIYGLLAFCP